MANNLVNSTWIPPEAQSMSKLVKWGSIIGIGMVGIYAFTRFAPTMVDAVTLLDTILQDTTHMAISGGILLATALVLNETFSSTGKINMLLRLPYWIAVRGLTRMFLTIDPFATIDQRITQVEADEELFDTQTQKMSGIITRLHEQEDACRAKSQAALKLVGIAHTRGNKDVENDKSHEFGEFRDTADMLAGLRGKVEPMLAQFQRFAKACDSTANKLKIERQTLQIKWDAQQAISGVVNSANRILGRSKTQVWKLAEQASEIVNTKYGDELGHLDHLKLVTAPLLDSIDLENGTYNEEALAAVQATGAKLLQATDATPLPAPANYTAADTSNVLSGFIH